MGEAVFIAASAVLGTPWQDSQQQKQTSTHHWISLLRPFFRIPFFLATFASGVPVFTGSVIKKRYLLRKEACLNLVVLRGSQQNKNVPFKAISYSKGALKNKK